MGLPEFDEDVILALATDASYDRGGQYADGGAVRNLVRDGETYRAEVYGTERYEVRLWDGSADEVDFSCTCPYDWGGACKHVVAVMLAVLERRRQGNEIPTAGPGEDAERPADPPRAAADPGRTDALLASLSAERLRAFVRLQVGEYPRLSENLQIFVQGAVESAKTVDAYVDDIAAALADVNVGSPWMEEYGYDHEGDDGVYDEVGEELEPFQRAARKYLDQNNRIESGKIHEAIFNACCRAGNDPGVRMCGRGPFTPRCGTVWRPRRRCAASTPSSSTTAIPTGPACSFTCWISPATRTVFCAWGAMSCAIVPAWRRRWCES